MKGEPMDLSHIDVILVDQWKIEDIICLYRSVNWWKEGSDSGIIPDLIKNSFAFVVAYDTKIEKTIGMGRVLSDGVSDAYIQDVVVLEKWRKKGVGRRIIQTLVDYCQKKNVEWIALISEPGQNSFYLPLGFKEMEHYVPMKYTSIR